MRLNHAALHEQDYALCLDQAVDLLRSRNFAEIDIEKLIEELAGMGSSQKQATDASTQI
jgi:Domain of unknown function DUF29